MAPRSISGDAMVVHEQADDVVACAFLFAIRLRVFPKSMLDLRQAQETCQRIHPACAPRGCRLPHAAATQFQFARRFFILARKVETRHAIDAHATARTAMA
jgi:hypothetical protein